MNRQRPPSRLEDAMMALALVAMVVLAIACVGAMLSG